MKSKTNLKVLLALLISAMSIGVVVAMTAVGVNQEYRNDATAKSQGSEDAAASLNGTGGGYDPDVEAKLAALDSSERLDPSNAIAYNRDLGDLPDSILTASIGISDDVSSGMIWSVVILGILLLCLCIYAVNALIGYSKESDF